ncbi:iron chaperone [Frisingicoccus sp.]
MWVCPKCGRAFKKQNQSHYCGDAPKTIDQYIEAQSEEVQPYLLKIRNAIHDAIPEAQERISWSMPTFWKGHNIIHFAANKKHIGLYAGEEAVIEFGDMLKPYKTSKGTIQIPYKEPLPLDLIARIAVWCYETGNHP